MTVINMIVLKSVLSYLVLLVRWLYRHLPVLKIDEGHSFFPAPHGAWLLYVLLTRFWAVPSEIYSLKPDRLTGLCIVRV